MFPEAAITALPRLPLGYTQSPGSIRSSDSGSPAVHSSASSEPSIRSGSLLGSERSSISSSYRTPDTTFAKSPPIDLVMPTGERLSSTDVVPDLKSIVENREMTSSSPHPTTYSILVICPADHAREALKQHIELVVPHQIAVNVTTVGEIEEWEQLVTLPEPPVFTHLVLNLPQNHDVESVMSYILQMNAKIIPEVVVVADLAQKKSLRPHFQALVQAGRKVEFVPKPAKPSFFSKIFDPSQQRDLSKDRNRDMIQEVSNTFKTVTKMVQDSVGNKGHRIMVVEDDETNRGVMMKYLEKVKIYAETATNGEECVNMVYDKGPGYYSLIICDIQMPVKDGYETCRELREWETTNKYPQTPIIALSANAMSEQIENASKAGFNDYVTKPLKHSELGKMIMNLLDPRAPKVLLRDRKR